MINSCRVKIVRLSLPVCKVQRDWVIGSHCPTFQHSYLLLVCTFHNRNSLSLTDNVGSALSSVWAVDRGVHGVQRWCLLCKMIQSKAFTMCCLCIGKGQGRGGDTVSRQHCKGCNCKRSGCLKNYCECYEVCRVDCLLAFSQPVCTVETAKALSLISFIWYWIWCNRFYLRQRRR